MRRTKIVKIRPISDYLTLFLFFIIMIKQSSEIIEFIKKGGKINNTVRSVTYWKWKE